MTDQLTCPQTRARRAVRSALLVAALLFLVGLVVPLWAISMLTS